MSGAPLDPTCELCTRTRVTSGLSHPVRWRLLVARHGQDVPRAALGEIWLRLVDLGLHDDGALPAVQAALDGRGHADQELPLLAAPETIKKIVIPLFFNIHILNKNVLKQK